MMVLMNFVLVILVMVFVMKLGVMLGWFVRLKLIYLVRVGSKKLKVVCLIVKRIVLM